MRFANWDSNCYTTVRQDVSGLYGQWRSKSTFRIKADYWHQAISENFESLLSVLAKTIQFPKTRHTSGFPDHVWSYAILGFERHCARVFPLRKRGEKDEQCVFTNADHSYTLCMPRKSSMGKGNTMVEFFSAAIELSVCKYRSCRAEGESAITSAASFRAREALCSPSAAITWELKQN